MQEKLKEYLADIGLQISNVEVEENLVKELRSILEVEPTIEEVERLVTYKVPKLSPDGSCSIVDELDDRPYNLKETLHDNGFKDEDIYSLVGKLDKVVEFLHKEIGADWTGIYKKLNKAKGPALVKLAYRGNPSRAEFPLAEKFAEHSNNSTVGLSGKAVLIKSLNEHLEAGKPYYECDNKVQSELCVPIFGKDNEIIGIIDLEAFQENFFDEVKIAKVAVVCLLLPDQL